MVAGCLPHQVRVSSQSIWQLGRVGGPYRRSPDPMYEHEAFGARALSLLEQQHASAHHGALGLLEPTAQPVLVRDAAALLDGPVCELLLDQRLMNGVGNYLRAEILYRARVPPFESARCALERARDAANARAQAASGTLPVFAKSPPDLLTAVRDVLRQAVLDKGRDWLNVYAKHYSLQEVDGLGRVVWYRGERGPLPSTVYEASGAWDSLFISRIAELIGKAELHALCAHFGAVEHVTYNGRRR